MSTENNVPTPENQQPAEETVKTKREKDPVGALIYAVIAAVNLKICYDFVPAVQGTLTALKDNGASSLLLLLLTVGLLVLTPVVCTSAAAAFSRAILGRPVLCTDYYAVLTALPYAAVIFIMVKMGLFLFILLALVPGALSMLCTHAIITYEKGKPFRI